MISVFLESDFLHFTWEFPRVGKLQLLNHTDAMVVAVCCQDVTLSVCGNRSTCTCTDTLLGESPKFFAYYVINFCHYKITRIQNGYVCV